MNKRLQQEEEEEEEEEEGEDYEEQYEDEDDDGDFDANELLNLTDYQNKRKQLQDKPSMAAAAKPSHDGAIEISNDDDDDGWGDDWGAPKKPDLSNFDYKNTNLNKLSNEQIALHKKKMDENFHKNQLKPGDKGFEYDKRIDFTKKKQVEDDDEENSWDEGDGNGENLDNYFDDDFM